MGLLVLERKIGEALIIGDDIQVVVVAMRSGHVKLGIDAPRHLPVDRAEIRARRVLDVALSKQAGRHATGT